MSSLSDGIRCDWGLAGQVEGREEGGRLGALERCVSSGLRAVGPAAPEGAMVPTAAMVKLTSKCLLINTSMTCNGVNSEADLVAGLPLALLALQPSADCSGPLASTSGPNMFQDIQTSTSTSSSCTCTTAQPMTDPFGTLGASPYGCRWSPGNAEQQPPPLAPPNTCTLRLPQHLVRHFYNQGTGHFPQLGPFSQFPPTTSLRQAQITEWPPSVPISSLQASHRLCLAVPGAQSGSPLRLWVQSASTGLWLPLQAGTDIPQPSLTLGGISESRPALGPGLVLQLPSPSPLSESSTLSMFFRDNDAWKAETGWRRNKAVDGILDPFSIHSNPWSPQWPCRPWLHMGNSKFCLSEAQVLSILFNLQEDGPGPRPPSPANFTAASRNLGRLQESPPRSCVDCHLQMQSAPAGVGMGGFSPDPEPSSNPTRAGDFCSVSHHEPNTASAHGPQQSQVYRSQPDLVSAVYDTTVPQAVDYSYAQYPNPADASQNYSQYLYPSEYTADSTWIAPEQPPPRPATPEKFTIPHRCARFGPGGHMVQVLPNLPSAGQPALVDIHNLETMLQDTPDQAELRAFPGPLVKEETHKVDVIKFSQNKALECSRDNNLLDRDSARLLWDFIMLLCRQNGTVVGTDIADLLLKEHRSVWLPGKSPNEANLIDFNNEPLARAEEEPGAGPLSLLSDTFMTVPENVGKETERFRELLLFGRKKDALEAAMKGGLWGHALLLASKMDNRTHARVMTRFANSLPINDPLQTVYQLMSGRMPASATCCGEEKWGDWRPHLAMVLSNLTHTLDLDTRTITTMGDTLASKGLIDAAHFCYLMAQVGLGVYTKKSTKMVLIGSNHSLPFYQFATNEAIQRTEAYEYALSLGSLPCSLPNFQVFKLIYACRLAEAGLSAQAFHYCEVISRTVLMQLSYYSPVFISQIIQISEKLRFFDPQLKEKPEQELFNEPEWLIHLRQLDGQIRTGVITYSADRTTPTQFECSSPSSDLDQPSPPEPYSMPLEMDGPTPDNPLMNSLLPGPPPQGVQLMPPAPTSILQEGVAPPQPLPPSDMPQFYPVPPTGPPGQIPVSGYPPQDPGFAPPPFQPQHDPSEMYPGAHQQPQPPQMGQMSPHMPPQVPHSPVQMNHPLPQMPQHMPPSPGHMPHVEHPLQAPPEMQPAQPMSSSPPRGSVTPQMDFYDHMANMGPGRRSRTSTQSSVHMAPGRRSRTTSESSTHSAGRERSNSAVKQASPPPPSIPEQPRKEEAKKVKKDSPKKSGGVGGWLSWISGRGKNEAHLPDDKNKSIVWDEKKQRWVDLNEPEEESKPPPPPPSGFPKMAPMPGPGGPAAPPSSGPPVNMFSRKAGTKSRYVDVLNPSRTAKPGGLAPAPADIFAPLAPMPMPTNLFVPTSAPNDQQPLEGSEGGHQEQNSPNTSAAPQMFNPTLLPPAPEGPPMPDGSQSGELSRSSSMSSLSREVSQHLNQSHPAQGTAPTGGVTFYNPAQFAQTSAPTGGGLRSGRLGGQRQYPVLK
ncbi:protein transport protein Sec16A [Lates japonicus]|uniref:Protein transport protein sec16 n=1 Tax=Lates japonicus TaxID=270547 RepID=A0AAD3MCW5_LATJO|nr:protein transport protein Sec16A [Lates japonicus]